MYFLYDASSKNILLTLVLVLAFVFFFETWNQTFDSGRGFINENAFSTTVQGIFDGIFVTLKL